MEIPRQIRPYETMEEATAAGIPKETHPLARAIATIQDKADGVGIIHMGIQEILVAEDQAVTLVTVGVQAETLMAVEVQVGITIHRMHLTTTIKVQRLK